MFILGRCRPFPSGRRVARQKDSVQLAGAVTHDNLELELRAGFDGRFTDEDDVRASLAGTNFRYAATDDESVLGAYVGMNANFTVNERWNVVADTEFRQSTGDETAISARLRGIYKF
jgi:hypothetical protein